MAIDVRELHTADLPTQPLTPHRDWRVPLPGWALAGGGAGLAAVVLLAAAVIGLFVALVAGPLAVALVAVV